MKYKVGDQVYVKSWEQLLRIKKLEQDWGKGKTSLLIKNVWFNYEMKKLCNHLVTISYITNTGVYKIKEDNGTWVWTDDFLERRDNKELKKIKLSEPEIDYISGLEITEGYKIWTPEGYRYTAEIKIIYSSFYGDWVAEKDVVRTIDDNLVFKDEAVYSDYCEGYLIADDTVETIRGRVVPLWDAYYSSYYDGYIIGDDVVELTNGDCILKEDAVYSDYYDGYIPLNTAIEADGDWVNEDDDEAIERLLYKIHEYGWQPEFYPKKMAFENTINIGFELEVATSDRGDVAEAINDWLEENDLQDRIYLTNDSSISYGFEIVSQPATWKWMRNHMKLYEFFQVLKSSGARADWSTGLHFHMTSDKITDRQIGLMAEFITRHFETLKPIFRRGYNDYADELSSSDIRDLKYGYSLNSRYRILNNQGIGLEFRMFKSTVDYSQFLVALQFVDAITSFFEYRLGYSLPSFAEFYHYIRWAGYTHLWRAL